jgi:hypothetical protein
MAEHEKVSRQKQGEVDQKHRVRQKEPEPPFDQSYGWEQGTDSISETPFRPRMDQHTALLAAAHSDESRANLVLHLQRTYGNQYVQRLLNSRVVQAKLTVSQPDDSYEREADRVAQQVMNMSTVPANPEHLPAQADGGLEVGSELESRLIASKGSGSPLPEGVRTYMEPRFGADFSGVRVHTDRESARMNRELSAQAFTHGRDIYMGEGKYNPGSDTGKRLLAHELTHVVQQGGAIAEAEPQPAFGWTQRQSASSRREAAFDVQDSDKTKAEANITWMPPKYISQAGAIPTHDGQVKTQDVSWSSADYSSDTSNGASSCVEKTFTVNYKEVDDKASNAWKLGVSSISGGATITVHTGGSQNAIDNPPTTEAEAQEAVTVMKGYYNRGSRGKWHTEAASKDHELYHYREWKETCEHYWPTCRTAIENLTVSKDAQPDKGPAMTDLKNQADNKANDFKAKAREYWFTLGDGAGDRPYAAGQLTLNEAIKSVQKLAGTKKWTVEQGTDSPSTDTPCYQPWLPYNP